MPWCLRQARPGVPQDCQKISCLPLFVTFFISSFMIFNFFVFMILLFIFSPVTFESSNFEAFWTLKVQLVNMCYTWLHMFPEIIQAIDLFAELYPRRRFRDKT